MMDGLDDSVMNELQSHSITYRIAMGPQQGRKVFTLQTIPVSFANIRTPWCYCVSGISRLVFGDVAFHPKTPKLARA
jgi:hypothetical protein